MLDQSEQGIPRAFLKTRYLLSGCAGAYYKTIVLFQRSKRLEHPTVESPGKRDTLVNEYKCIFCFSLLVLFALDTRTELPIYWVTKLAADETKYSSSMFDFVLGLSYIQCPPVDNHKVTVIVIVSVVPRQGRCVKPSSKHVVIA
jgi:hypothetical protein